ncbi:MAG: UxaA family hydrolase [Geminicoccaceae bacterium]|nr:UxaA family hydrolase [Geminicoccaceae bacterium]
MTDRETAPATIAAVKLHPADNVATAIEPIEAGASVTVDTPDGPIGIVATQAVPLCHKIALEPLPHGTEVRKYGETIGATTTAVAQGGLVHVQTMRSLRARPTGEPGA